MSDPSNNYGAGALPTGGSTDKRDPIGVPKGYTITQPYDPAGIDSLAAGTMAPGDFGGGMGPTVETGPRYYAGDEWSAAPTNSQDMLFLQKEMIETGLLDPGGIVYGQWDPKSASAFSKLLAISNQAGVEWQTAIGTRMAAVYAAGNTREVKKNEIPPLVVKLTNPDDLRAVAKNVSRTLYGGDLPDEDLNRFVASYQASEREAQTQAHFQQWDPNLETTDAEGNKTIGGYGPGGEVVSEADPKNAIEAQIRREHPAQVGATAFGTQVTNALANLRSTGYLS